MKSTTKVTLGMRRSWWFPITSEPDIGKALYGAKVDTGSAVKGYLSITTASGSISGDDRTQFEVEKFVSAQLDAETTMNDLEINATLFGHTFAEESGEVSSVDDYAPSGGYAFIEPVMLKDKSVKYRATCLHKVTAIASSEKQEADTRKSGELAFKNNVVSFKVSEDNTGAWRTRKEFDTQAAAETFIEGVYAKS